MKRPRRLARSCALAFVAMSLVPAPAAFAADWITDAAVGPNQLEFSLQITCPAPSFECSLLDGYLDVQTSILAGAGTAVIDSTGDTMTFESDSLQDIGGGPEPATLTMTGSDMSFANIPFAGIPEIVNLRVFSLAPAPIDVPGLDLATPGDHAFTQSLDYSSISEVAGDLEFLLPDLVVPPQPVILTGVLRVLGDVDMDGLVEFEVRDLGGTLNLQAPATLGGEPVTIDVTAVFSANLSGSAALPAPPLPTVPGLGASALMVLCASMLAGGVRALEG